MQTIRGVAHACFTHFVPFVTERYEIVQLLEAQKGEVRWIIMRPIDEPAGALDALNSHTIGFGVIIKCDQCSENGPYSGCIEVEIEPNAY